MTRTRTARHCAHYRTLVKRCILALVVATIACHCIAADSDTLRDLGTNAVQGEVPKFDGKQWRNAHDDITTVVAGPGLIGAGTNKTITLSVNLGGEGTSTTVARFADMDATRPPLGAIIAWAKTLTGVQTNLPIGWVECNGQTLTEPSSPLNGALIPDLNGVSGPRRFLRGSNTAGATGGSDSKELDSGDRIGDTRGTTWAVVKGPGGSLLSTAQGDNDYARASYTISDIKPPFFEVVWIMRVK